MGAMIVERQTTLRTDVTITGIGVHSGAPATLTLSPAPVNTGIVFRRETAQGTVSIAARHDQVTAAELSTVLGDPAQGGVATVEHFLAACRGMGLDNVIAEMDGPETPILDGASEAFIEAILGAGLETQQANRRFLKVLKTVRVERGDAWAELAPNARGFSMDVEIDFPSSLIGRQRIVLDMTPRTFRKELAWARTFGFLKDVERLWAAGFARGSSLENSIVIDGDRVLNAEGLRAQDHFVRHKALDAVGDLALAGLPLKAEFRSYKSGHRLNVDVVKALIADPSAWTIHEAEPALRVVGHADAAPALQPAFAPEQR